MIDNLKIYNVSQRYYNYIRRYDDKIPYLNRGKENRPFIGIVLSINDCLYFAPLTSPKPKHLHMRNMEDFQKIAEGKLGAINFNNMIPVPKNELKEMNLEISFLDTKDTILYKKLLEKQRIWCNQNRYDIYNKAEVLNRIIYNPEKAKLRERCCDFKLLEEKCKEYEAGLTLNRQKISEIEL